MPPRKNLGRLAVLQRETRVPEPYVLTPDVVIAPPTRAQMQAIREVTGEEQWAILFGEHWEAVKALFDDQPDQLWDAFSADVSKHFFGPGVDDVEGKSEDSSES
jgi:hypothetical protein